jgi:cytochrome c oxidase subunit 2
MFNIPLFPERASSFAGQVDNLYFFIIGVVAFFAVLVVAFVIFFAIRYRRRHAEQVGVPVHLSLALELTWTGIPLVLAMMMFVWGATVFFALSRPPANAMEIYAVGKRWMWKFQHVTGQREIDELHVPVGQPVKVLLGSEDVIHSLYFPTFRTKMDAVPGRTTSLWFEPTKPGRYHIFCAEYCGMRHSAMIGTVIVMEPAEFQAWLAGGPAMTNMVEAGLKLFTDLACVTCHREDSAGRGPSLRGLFGKSVRLLSGGTVTADENYIRESIVNPQAKIVEGFQPNMPTFQGLVSEEQLMQLLAYVKSLAAQAPAGRPSTAAQPSPERAAPAPK